MANGIWKDSQQHLSLENFQLNINEIPLTYTNKMAQIPKLQQCQLLGKNVEQQKHLFIVTMQKSTKTLENSLEVSYRVTQGLTIKIDYCTSCCKIKWDVLSRWIKNKLWYKHTIKYYSSTIKTEHSGCE